MISLVPPHRIAAGHTCNVQFFSHPDYTVGFGIAPNLPEGSRTIPPVGICTLPRRTYSIEEIIAPRFAGHNTKKHRGFLYLGSCHQWQPPKDKVSVQKDILRRLTSTKQSKDSLYCSSYSPSAQEFGTEACFEHILVPQETRFPGRCCLSWTRFFAFNASVPKNMKNVFVRTRISRSKLLHRDEKI